MLKNIVILGASFETSNLGVSALIASTIFSINNDNPDANIKIIDYNSTSKIYRHDGICIKKDVELINIRFSKNILLSNNIAVLIVLSVLWNIIPSFLYRRIFPENQTINAFLDADVVFSIAGGDSFSDIYGLERFMYVFLPMLLAILLKKKLVLLPQTIGPFNVSTSKSLANIILSKADIIYTRDPKSIWGLIKFPFRKNTPSRVNYCPDVAFALPTCIHPDMVPNFISDSKIKRKSIVGINISGLLSIGGYTRNNMFGLLNTYEELMHKVAVLFAVTLNCNVVLVPHVNSNNSNIESDVSAIERVYSSLPIRAKEQVFILQPGYNQSEIKGIIGYMDYFVGSRMHACIAAISQNIPTVGFAYSDKFIGIFESAGIRNNVIDLRNSDNDNTLTSLRLLYDEREKTKKILEGTIPGLKCKIRDMFKHVLS